MPDLLGIMACPVMNLMSRLISCASYLCSLWVELCQFIFLMYLYLEYIGNLTFWSKADHVIFLFLFLFFMHTLHYNDNKWLLYESNCAHVHCLCHSIFEFFMYMKKHLAMASRRIILGHCKCTHVFRFFKKYKVRKLWPN